MKSLMLLQVPADEDGLERLGRLGVLLGGECAANLGPLPPHCASSYDFPILATDPIGTKFSRFHTKQLPVSYVNCIILLQTF